MKVIDKCKELCAKELEKLNNQYDEALMNYQDTGYDRYYNKMGRVEQQIEELTKFIEGDAIAKSEANRYKRMYQEIKDILFYINSMIDNLTDDDFTSPGVNQIIDQLQKMRRM